METKHNTIHMEWQSNYILRTSVEEGYSYFTYKKFMRTIGLFHAVLTEAEYNQAKLLHLVEG
jgi:hypothetical protein